MSNRAARLAVAGMLIVTAVSVGAGARASTARAPGVLDAETAGDPPAP
jgi:hypothetical protein